MNNKTEETAEETAEEFLSAFEDVMLTDEECNQIVIDAKLVKAGFYPLFDDEFELDPELIHIMETTIDDFTWNFEPYELLWIMEANGISIMD